LRIGLIGTGSMGAMLIRAFSRCAHAGVSEMVACNRSPEKLKRLRKKYPHLRCAENPQEVVRNADTIFLCVKPADAMPVLQEIRHPLTADHYLISINSAFSLKELEDTLPCKVLKAIPSITQEALAGAILVMHGTRMGETDRAVIDGLLLSIGHPVHIAEEDIRVCSDLSSCGPAFLAWILQEFTRAAARQGGIAPALADTLLKETLFGLGKLVKEEKFSFEDVIRRVAIPGGITETGLRSLEGSLTGAFDVLLQTTKTKHQDHVHSAKHP
jgi:competence protein ComER